MSAEQQPPQPVEAELVIGERRGGVLRDILALALTIAGVTTVAIAVCILFGGAEAALVVGGIAVLLGLLLGWD